MQQVSTETLIEKSRVGKLHVTVLAWTMFLILFDGYDLSILGVVIPVLHEEWGISTVMLGSVASLTLIGSLIGAFVAGVAADHVGRKKVLTCCVILFSVFTFVNAFATSMTTFAVCRFIAGLGLGGIPPLVVALTAEYAPKHLRNQFVGIMFSGYSIGGILVALLGMYMMPYTGWQGLFIVGALPLLLLPFMMKSLPESLPFLAATDREEMQRVLQRLHIDTTHLQITVKQRVKSPLRVLFTRQYRRITLSFWTICFMGLLLVYGLSTWLPQMMRAEGYGITSSILFLLVLNVGAIIGSLVGGRCADRFGSKRVQTILYTAGALSLLLLMCHFSSPWLYILIAISGAASIGAQNLNNACNASYYDASSRGAALGAALSVGRIGAIIGPSIGGLLLAAEVASYWHYILFAIPACIAACMYVFLPKRKEG